MYYLYLASFSNCRPYSTYLWGKLQFAADLFKCNYGPGPRAINPSLHLAFSARAWLCTVSVGSYHGTVHGSLCAPTVKLPRSSAYKSHDICPSDTCLAPEDICRRHYTPWCVLGRYARQMSAMLIFGGHPGRKQMPSTRYI